MSLSSVNTVLPTGILSDAPFETTLSNVLGADDIPQSRARAALISLIYN